MLALDIPFSAVAGYAVLVLILIGSSISDRLSKKARVRRRR